MTDLPPGWEWTTLEQLAAPEPRAITDGPFGSALTSSHYTSKGARVIRLQNIGDGEFVDERAFISFDHFETLKKHEVLEGDLLIASLGDNPPRACIAPDLGGPSLVKADCIRVRLTDAVDAQFVLYALLSPSNKKRAAELIKGVGRPRLGLGAIKGMLIPLPPFAEQQLIASFLARQFSTIRSARDQMTTSAAGLPALRSSIRRSVLSRASYEMYPLSCLIERIEAGKSRGGAAPPAREDEWGVVKVSSMTWGRFDPDQNKSVDPESVDSRHEIHENDLLVSRANTAEYVGAPVLVGPVRSKLLLSDKSLRLIPKPDVDKRWLLHCLASPEFRSYVSVTATGTKDSMRNISQAALVAGPIRLVDTSEQIRRADEIDQQLAAVNRLETAISAAMRGADSLERALLDSAFAGHITSQDPDDEPASVLLDRIREERAGVPSSARRRPAASKVNR